MLRGGRCHLFPRRFCLRHWIPLRWVCLDLEIRLDPNRCSRRSARH